MVISGDTGERTTADSGNSQDSALSDFRTTVHTVNIYMYYIYALYLENVLNGRRLRGSL